MRKKLLWSRILVGCYLVPGLVLVIASNGCATSNCKDAVMAAETHSLYVESVLSAGIRGNELLVRYTVTDVNGYGLMTRGVKGLRRQAVFSLEPWRYEPKMTSTSELGSATRPIVPIRLVSLPESYRADTEPHCPCPMCPGRQDAHFHWPEYENIVTNLDREAAASPALYAVLPPPKGGSRFGTEELLFIHVPAQRDPVQCRSFLISIEHAPLKARAWAMRAMYPLAIAADVVTAPIQIGYFLFFFRD
jgi:hypothetical protein